MILYLRMRLGVELDIFDPSPAGGLGKGIICITTL